VYAIPTKPNLHVMSGQVVLGQMLVLVQISQNVKITQFRQKLEVYAKQRIQHVFLEQLLVVMLFARLVHYLVQMLQMLMFVNLV
jgi:hypothetical protein